MAMRSGPTWDDAVKEMIADRPWLTLHKQRASEATPAAAKVRPAERQESSGMNSFGGGGWRAFGDGGRDSRGRRDDRRMDDRSRPHWDRWRDGAGGSQWPDSSGPERKGKDISMKRSRSRGWAELCKLF